MSIGEEVLIFGCGNLGWRHVEGTLKSSNVSRCHVVDLKQENIRETKLLLKHEIDRIVFYNNLESVLQKFEIAVIATSSAYRENLIRQIAEKTV